MRADTRAVNMPSLPLGAQDEILNKLFNDMHIHSDDIVKILKKYEVEGDVDALQDAYRRRVGQRLMASIRDGTGKREVLSQMAGLGNSAEKVHGRIGVLERLGRLFGRGRRA